MTLTLPLPLTLRTLTLPLPLPLPPTLPIPPTLPLTDSLTHWPTDVKAERDGKSAGVLSKLAAEAAGLYEDVHLKISEARSRSRPIAAMTSDWLSVVDWNRMLFDGLQHFYMAQVCVCVHVYAYACTCLRMHVRMHVCGMHLHTYARVHVCMHACGIPGTAAPRHPAPRHPALLHPAPLAPTDRIFAVSA